jgi:GNAT superfamily N-acetyltransferase
MAAPHELRESTAERWLDRTDGMSSTSTRHAIAGVEVYGLDHLVVAPDARRRGIGRALVHHAAAQARAAGASRVDLAANERKQAVTRSRALGFR